VDGRPTRAELQDVAAGAVIERAESVLSERANKPEAQARRR
jgi:hypothetical protein